MGTKVFLKWLGADGENGLTTGREYAFEEWHIVNDSGKTLYTNGTQDYWQRIEREVFTANGFEWFRHVPGEPMPCDPEANVVGLSMCMREFKNKAQFLDWTHNESGALLIVWRYADSEQKEPAITFSQAQDGTNWNVADFGVVPYDAQSNSPQPLSDGKLWPLGGLDAKRFNENAGCIGDSGTVLGRAWIDPFPADVWIGVDFAEDPSERNDLIAAVDDGHLTPGQKAYIQGKEDAQAAKQQLKHDAEAKALQERAESLSDAGKAMDRVNQDHSHKLGWRQ